MVPARALSAELLASAPTFTLTMKVSPSPRNHNVSMYGCPGKALPTVHSSLDPGGEGSGGTTTVPCESPESRSVPMITPTPREGRTLPLTWIGYPGTTVGDGSRKLEI